MLAIRQEAGRFKAAEVDELTVSLLLRRRRPEGKSRPSCAIVLRILEKKGVTGALLASCANLSAAARPIVLYKASRVLTFLASMVSRGALRRVSRTTGHGRPCVVLRCLPHESLIHTDSTGKRPQFHQSCAANWPWYIDQKSSSHPLKMVMRLCMEQALYTTFFDRKSHPSSRLQPSVGEAWSQRT